MQRLNLGTFKAKGPTLGSVFSGQNPTTSGTHPNDTQLDIEDEQGSFWNCCYNKSNNTFCGRTCKSWGYIIVYAIMYLIFLATFFMLCLFGALLIIKYNEEYLIIDKSDLYEFSDEGVGLTGIPFSEVRSSVIWYRNGKHEDMAKYISAIDLHLNRDDKTRKKREVKDFGPCGVEPYGYGEEPCIFIRINRKRNWSAEPIKMNSNESKAVPVALDSKDERPKLWLLCKGINPWDRDHLGSIRYYPYPGFDPGLFPLEPSSPSPMVAVQFTSFTLGISLSIECKVLYVGGVSKLEFLLYVANPK